MRILAGRGADAHEERERPLLTLEEGRITGYDRWTEATLPEAGDLDMRGCLLLPGFLDIHVHGGAGHNVMDLTPEALSAVSAHLARHGVTGYLATTVTAPWEAITHTMEMVDRAMRKPQHTGARLLGCHLEGPYINPVKKGAQPEQYIRTPNAEEFLERTGSLLNIVKIVTLAPEMEGALELIRLLAEKGIIASLGHTNATVKQMQEAAEAGARHVTHCFNAMRPLEGREPGVVGAAFALPELKAELIWDNIHVHPLSCRALIYAKQPSGVILISDGIPGAGMGEGYAFSLGDLSALVKNGAARLPDGTLAGSLLTLDTAFGNAGAFSLCERSAMTSFNAATALGLSAGLLTPGYAADLVLLDPQGKVQCTIVEGRIVYQN